MPIQSKPALANSEATTLRPGPNVWLTPLITLAVLILTAGHAAAQDDDLDLVSLLEMKIESASKKAESLFDAPVSSCVVTSQDLEDSGATTIEEGLRSCPGFIVRERTSGTYDVHARVVDGIVPRGSFLYRENRNMLIMVDNRVVFDYTVGNTLWAGLPIAIEDVKRIEVVRGPMSALYGPNAVTGVINVLTKHHRRYTEENEWSVRSHLEGGLAQPFETRLGDGTVDHYPIQGRGSVYASQSKENMSLTLSANVLRRDRTDTSYYSYYHTRHVDDPRRVAGIDRDREILIPEGDLTESIPDVNLGIQRFGISAYGNANFEGLEVAATAGFSGSHAQTVGISGNNFTPMITEEMDTQFTQFKVAYEGFQLNTSWTQLARRTLEAGKVGVPTRSEYIEADLEYNYEHEYFEVRPGLAGKRLYIDSPSMESNDDGTLAHVASAYVRAETNLSDFRLVGALRGDSYSHKPERIQPTYNLAATYSLGNNHLLRVGYGRAKRYLFMLDVYAEAESEFWDVRGNKELNPLTADTVELGYRGKFFGMISADFEVFATRIQDITQFESEGFNDSGALSFTYNNVPTEGEQLGGTFALSAVPTQDLRLKAHVTVQRSRARGGLLEEDLTGGGNVYSNAWERAKSTPAAYGGGSLDYSVIEGLRLHVDGYFLSKQDLVNNNGAQILEPAIVLNSKVAYDVHDGVTAFLNVRNINLGGKTQFMFADQMGELVMLGADLKF